MTWRRLHATCSRGRNPAADGRSFRRVPADAYSTGEALYALHEAGTRNRSAAWRKGIAFLLSAQAADGTWHVRTRMISPADVSPPYFTTGFPYKKDEYLSYAASCWATMALLSGNAGDELDAAAGASRGATAGRPRA